MNIIKLILLRYKVKRIVNKLEYEEDSIGKDLHNLLLSLGFGYTTLFNRRIYCLCNYPIIKSQKIEGKLGFYTIYSGVKIYGNRELKRELKKLVLLTKKQDLAI